MTQERLRELLGKLLVTHSPGGDEREMDELVGAELGRFCDEVWRDPHGNVVGKLAGKSSEDAVQVLAHKDEIATIVHKIDDDGKIWLDPVGGAYPFMYAEGPMDLLGDEIVTGVLSAGSKHSTAQSPRIHKVKTQVMTWDMIYLDCKLSKEELAAKGVQVGTRAVVSRCRKEPLYLGEHVCDYALDDKALVAVMLLAGAEVAAHGPPPLDVYLVATTSEEGGCSGGAYATQNLPGHTVIALDVAPVAEEYPVELDDRPVITYMDQTTYDKPLSDGLAALADELGFGAQRALFRSLGTDVGYSTKYGHVSRPASLGVPTENTHGYEIARLGAMTNCARLVSAFLLRAEPQKARPLPTSAGQEDEVTNDA